MARRSAMGLRADVLTEVYICLVHSIAHSAYILLHEPHVSSLSDDDEGMRKSLASADEILQAIFLTLSPSRHTSDTPGGQDTHRPVREQMLRPKFPSTPLTSTYVAISLLPVVLALTFPVPTVLLGRSRS